MKPRFYTLCLLGLALLTATTTMAIKETSSSTDPAEVRYIKNIKRVPDGMRQAELSRQDFWQSFIQTHGAWYVEFNEATGFPHRAAGKGIPTWGSSPEQKAMNFINNRLGDFGIPLSSLQLQNTATNGKYDIVNYYQVYNGLKVMSSNVTFRITTNSNLVPMYGIDVFTDVNVNTTPTLSAQAIGNYARNGITKTITNTTVQPDLLVLPIEKEGENYYNYHLVYEIMVEAEGGIPAKYYTLVDAHNGKVLYRQNQVHTTCGPGGDPPPTPAALSLHLEGAITDNPLSSTVVRGLPYSRTTINGNTVYTDNLGDVSTSDNPTVPATYRMRGTYARVYTGATGTNMAQFNGNITTSNYTQSFDANSTDSERSGYYHTNAIHDHMKTLAPGPFTTMDGVMIVRVDRTDGNCNAFYNGDINFYAQGGGCPATALFSDVIYHEYGHGINYNLYSYYGGNFNNGALGEGYADVWAFTLSLDPVLGLGFQTAPTSYVRRYDINPKVYPRDLVGQVHADGEIIAGCWWDTNENLQNWTLTNDIWMGTWPATLTAASGQEGTLYKDILMEALMYDDDDANLFNGTPNGTDICAGFGMHGISLISGATLSHTEVLQTNEWADINIDATLNIGSTTYLGDVKMYWTTNTSQTFTEVIMTNTSGNDYTAVIPGQVEGTIVHYYMGVTDNVCGGLTSVSPGGADLNPANIAFNILVGYGLEETEDFDFTAFSGSWLLSVNDDDATTGQWDINLPIGSYLNWPDINTLVQPSYQHTPSGQLCAITGNAPSDQDGIGTNDVDGGKTTLTSPVLDLAQYTKPAFTYHRWWTNETGANPVTDWLQISISNDGGNSWTFVENTLVADRSWRRYAFRVEDVISTSTNMKFRFVVSDSIKVNQGLQGGSLIECALDDLQIWSEGGTGIDEKDVNIVLNVYPNPASDAVTLSYRLVNSDEVSIQVMDYLGQTVHAEQLGSQPAGWNKLVLQTDQFAQGIYLVNFIAGDQQVQQKLTIVK